MCQINKILLGRKKKIFKKITNKDNNNDNNMCYQSYYFCLGMVDIIISCMVDTIHVQWIHKTLKIQVMF